MELSTLLEELGTSTGLDGLAFDADGQCSLLFDGEHEVTFVRDPEDRSLILYCELGKLPAQADGLCLRLMQASLLGAETGGAALSVHGAQNTVVLWKRHDENFEDLTALKQALNAFLAQVIHWKERLPEEERQEGGETSLERPDLNAYGMFV